LKYELGRGLANPHFYSSIHKLREIILTDRAFVNSMIVNFIEAILEEWAKAEKKRQDAVSSFWELHKEITDKGIYPSTKTPNIINKEDKHLRMSAKEIKKEIMDKFGELLKNHENTKNK